MREISQVLMCFMSSLLQYSSTEQFSFTLNYFINNSTIDSVYICMKNTHELK